MAVRRGGAAVALIALACSDPAPAPMEPADAGASVADAVVVEVEPPAPPAPPAPPEAPRMTCPPGWRADSARDVTLCEPYAPSGFQDCGDGLAHFPGEAGCVVVGDPCPAGSWPEGLPAGRSVFYVRPGASGDGSLASPAGSLDDAILAATSGSIIALSKGTHAPPLFDLDGGLFWGACAAETKIIGDDTDLAVISGPADSQLEVRNVTLGGATGVVAADRATVVLDGVVIDGAVGAGIEARDDGVVRGEEVVVRNTLSFTDPVITLPSVGVDIWDGTVDLRRAVISNHMESGVVGLGEATRIKLVDAVIHGSGKSGDHELMAGVYSSDGQVELERVALISNPTGVSVDGVLSGACTARLTDVLIADSFGGDVTEGLGVGLIPSSCDIDALRLGVRDSGWQAIFIEGGSTVRSQDLAVRSKLNRGATDATVVVNDGRLELDRGVIVDAVNTGVSIWGAGSSATLRDVEVRDVRESGAGSFGVVAAAGASLHGERLKVAGTSGGGIGIFERATFELADVTVVETAREPHRSGAAILAAFGVTGSVSRAHLATVVGIALHAHGAGTQVAASDVLIRDVRAVGVRSLGVQVVAASLAVERMSIANTVGVGLLVAGDGSATLADVSIERTDSATAAEDGMAIAVSGAVDGSPTPETAMVDGERLRLDSNRTASILVDGSGAQVNLREVSIQGTARAHCAATDDCLNGGGGHGVVAANAGALTLSGFRVVDNAIAGLVVASGAELDLERGLVAENRIGVAVLQDDYDVNRLTSGVAYLDNEVNLDARQLPLPSAPPPLPPPPTPSPPGR